MSLTTEKKQNACIYSIINTSLDRLWNWQNTAIYAVYLLASLCYSQQNTKYAADFINWKNDIIIKIITLKRQTKNLYKKVTTTDSFINIKKQLTAK